jgi:hypothetical protein
MRKTSKLFSLLAVAMMLVAGPVLADTAAPTVTINGLVDVNYTHNFTNSTKGTQGAGNPGVFFNNTDNAYNLGMAEAVITATQGSAKGVLDMVYGQEVNLGLGAPGINVLQAYAAYTAEQWTFTAGRWATWMGNEVIPSKANMNYSRSLLFWYTIPLWHNGLAINFAPDAQFGITGYVSNGWNNSTASLAAGMKTWGLQLLFKPDSTLTMVVNGIMGPHPFNPADYNSRTVIEGIITLAASDKFTVALDAEWGTQALTTGTVLTAPDLTTTVTPSASTFWGVALYGKFQFEPDWAAALRLEMVKDEHNILGLYGIGTTTTTAMNAFDAEAREVTFTLEHNFTPAFLVRAEGRYDMALSGGAAYAALSPTVPLTGNAVAGPFAAVPLVSGEPNQATASVSGVFSF